MRRLAAILLSAVLCASLSAQKTTIDATRLLKPSTALYWPRTNSAGTAVEWISESAAQSALNYLGKSGSDVYLSAGRLGIQTSTPAYALDVRDASKITTTDALGANTTTALLLNHSIVSPGTPSVGIGSQINFSCNLTQGERDGGYMKMVFTNVTSGSESSYFSFSPRNGAGALPESVRITPAGIDVIPFTTNGNIVTHNGSGTLASTSPASLLSSYVLLPVQKDIIAAATNIPAPSVREEGFWRVPSAYNGWKVVGVTYSVRTAGSGSGTVDLQAKRTTTGGTSVNFGAASFAATDLQKDIATSLTINTGDMLRLEIGGNSLSTTAQGLVVTYQLSPF